MKRYEITDTQWKAIKDFLPGKSTDVGRTAKDNRLFINAVLWILRSGARWADLPIRYGKYKSVHKRFTRWSLKGVWDKVFDARFQVQSATPSPWVLASSKKTS